jgi:hypothetical protein
VYRDVATGVALHCFLRTRVPCGSTSVAHIRVMRQAVVAAARRRLRRRMDGCWRLRYGTRQSVHPPKPIRPRRTSSTPECQSADGIRRPLPLPMTAGFLPAATPKGGEQIEQTDSEERQRQWAWTPKREGKRTDCPRSAAAGPPSILFQTLHATPAAGEAPLVLRHPIARV